MPKMLVPILLVCCSCAKKPFDVRTPIIQIESPKDKAIYANSAYVPVVFQLRDNRKFQSILLQCTDSAGNVIWHPKPGYPFNGAYLYFKDSFPNEVTQTTACKLRLFLKDKAGNSADTIISFTLLH